VGFVGVIVTVETPNVQRLATAVPALPLLAAVVLDDLARRAEALAVSWHRARPAATLLALALAAVLAGQQGIFYFTVYGATDRWPQPTVQGRAVADQGTDTLVVTVGREYHQINAGWVRLLAPNALRGGLQSPGIGLPLEIPAQHDLAFMLYPTQQMYLPYLQSVYPGGAIHPYTYPTEGLVVSMYRITREQWAATQGARVTSSGFGTTNVDGLGTLPRGVAHLPVSLTWTAGLRVSQYWNYGIRVGPGPARLRIDGVPVLTVPAGAAARTAKVALARGVHSLTLDATVLRRGAPPTITWKSLAPRDISGLAVPQGWQPLPEQDLVSNVVRPEGLTGVVEGAGTPGQRRIDGTLATCCLASDVRPQGGGFRAVWTGRLQAPRSGVYRMSLFTEGSATLQIDGRQVIRSTTPADNQADARVRLAAGSHDVRVQYDVPPGSPGGLEWSWTPPGGRQSIVPPLALSPGSDAVESPAPTSVLGKPTDQPQDEPLDELQ
jgi:hypothetical protein